MPKTKRIRTGKKLRNNPLAKKPVLPRTVQDINNQYDVINCTPQNTNILKTKQDLESAARLFAEFKQTYLNGDVGFIWIKDEVKDKFNKYRIVNGQLVNRIVNPSKGIVKGVMQVYNIEYKKRGIRQNNVKTLPLAGFLNDSSNFIIQVIDRKLSKQQLFNRFNNFKTAILTATGNNQNEINKLIYNMCGLLAPNSDQNNETALEMFNYRVKNIDGVVFESERGNRGGLITFIQRLAHMQGASLGVTVDFSPKSIFKGPNNNTFVLNDELSQNVTGCKGLELSEDPSINFQNSLKCGLWLQISLPSVPHLVTVIVRNGQLFTFGGGYNEPMIAIPQLTFEFGTMWVYSPDDLIFDTTDIENTQILVKWGFYNEDIQMKLNKMLVEFNQLYSMDRNMFRILETHKIFKLKIIIHL